LSGSCTRALALAERFVADFPETLTMAASPWSEIWLKGEFSMVRRYDLNTNKAR